jgi:hypothetical protein
MPYGITLSTWRGQNINDDTTYQAHFLMEGSEVLNTLEAAPVEIQRPQNTPLLAYTQPTGMHYEIKIVIVGTLSQSNLDQLKKWFTPLNTDLGALVGTSDSGSGSARRLMSVVKDFSVDVGEGPSVFTAYMYAPMGLWEDNSATTPTPTDVDQDPETLTLTNSGSADTPLVLTITADEDSPTVQTKQKLAFIANRSVEALQHFANEKYPIEITGGGIDTTSGFMANLNDLRVLLHGEEIPRWCYPTTSNAATKVWCNLHMEPGKYCTLAAAMDADDNTLTVDNVEGFAGWPENAWFFIDSEPVLATGISGFSAGSLYRPYPTTHIAGADIWWIEHVPAIIYGDADASAVPDWSDQEPVIDRTVSTNAFHRLNGPFFNDVDLRSRSALRRLPDSGESHIRTYDDGDGKLRWEDEPAEAGKPPLSVVQIDCPVPITSFQLDYEVEQSLILTVKGTDYGRDGGYVSDLLTSLWTNGELTDQMITPDESIKRLEIEARIGAVMGFIETTGVGVQAATWTSAEVRVENPFYDSVLGEYQSALETIRQESGVVGWSTKPWVPASLERLRVLDISLRFFVRFALQRDTVIEGILLYSSVNLTGDLAVGIYGSAGGMPDNLLVTLSTNSGATGLKVATPDFTTGPDRVVLNAGEYFLAFPSAGTLGVIAGRLHSELWSGYHDVFARRSTEQLFLYNDSIDFPDAQFPDTPTLEWEEYAVVQVPTEERFHTDRLSSTPIFAILSSETPPEDNAPKETGLIATIDNLRLTLDSDLAPLIVVGDEQSILLLDGEIENETTEQTLSVLYPIVVTEAITIDTDTAEATDGETDLPITHAVTYSVPLERLQLAPGDNTVVATGFTGTTIAPTFRGRYL